MSNITKSFTEEVTAFKGRELHDRYAAIYMDATYIPLKRKTVAKEAIEVSRNSRFKRSYKRSTGCGKECSHS